MEGRERSGFLVTATPKFAREVAEPIWQQLEKQVGRDVTALARRSIPHILKRLKARDQHARALAIEALVHKLMRLLDMTYVSAPLRSGAEARLLFHSSRLAFPRWQVCCAVTPELTLDSVAREVGLMHLYRSNVIFMITTGTISAGAQLYAGRIRASGIQLAMLDAADLNLVGSQPAAIVDIFSRDAQLALVLDPRCLSMWQ